MSPLVLPSMREEGGEGRGRREERGAREDGGEGEGEGEEI